jgi:hypothetical protein
MTRALAAKKAAATKGAVSTLLGERINLGSMIDKLAELREDKRALEGKVALIEAEYKEVEEALMKRLEAEGTDKATGKKATASITSSVVGDVTDWDALNAYIKKTGYFHLYQRRLSDPAVRELFDQKGKIPGVEPFTKKRLNLRAA